MNIKFEGNYFVQNKVVHPNNNNVGNTDYNIQNALFGAIKITKNTDSYEGYGICFDEGGTFSIRNINNGRNVLIFCVNMSFSIHSTNKANNIYVLGK